MRNIYIVGKESARLVLELSKLLPLNIVEMDATVQMLEGKSMEDIVEKEGLQGYLNMKQMLLNGISKVENQLISCSDDIDFVEANIEKLRATGIVCLADAEESQVMLKLKDYADGIFTISQAEPNQAAGEIIRWLAIEGHLH